MKYNVCVVGAGPAGLSAAFELLRLGARVAIVDRHRCPGGKVCGGGLTNGARAMLLHMLLASGEVGDDRCEDLASFDSLAVFSGSVARHAVQLHENQPYMHVSHRMRWQKRLLANLEKMGATVVSGTRARGIRDSKLMLSNDASISADFFVAADGAKSILRRQLKLPTAVGAVCRQLSIDKTMVPERISKTPSVWFDYRLFGASYGWVFPFEHLVRIGCGMPAGKGAARQLKQSFYSWLKQLEVPLDKGEMGSGSIGCRYAGHRFGNVFLAGDAAGMASSVTGEGIYQAFVSGKEIAAEILDSSYQSAVIPELAIRHERTFQTLNHSVFGRFLYDNAALFLKHPTIARAALRRFS